MKNPQIIFHSTPLVLAEAAALELVNLLAQPVATGRPFTVALSGGRIANDVFAAVTRLVMAQKVTLSNVHYFWGDERCVPPTDVESNFAAANQRLLRPLNIPENQIHRIRADQPEVTAIAAAESELCRYAPLDLVGRPALDLVLLGMGEDGHVASLFPGESEEVMNAPAVYRAVTGPKPPPRRITLGYGPITAARKVWVLASGKGKEAAFRESLLHRGTTPLARVLRMREQTVIFSDIRN
jgi:6-phosphogluconolactonase